MAGGYRYTSGGWDDLPSFEKGHRAGYEKTPAPPSLEIRRLGRHKATLNPEAHMRPANKGA